METSTHRTPSATVIAVYRLLNRFPTPRLIYNQASMDWVAYLKDLWRRCQANQVIRSVLREPQGDPGELDVLDAVRREAEQSYDEIRTLIDLARQDNRKDFEDLAAMLGVAPSRRAELWAGTQRRLAP